MSTAVHQIYIPVYVSKYEVTIQLAMPNPFKASVIETNEVLTIVVSSVDKKRPRHRLQSITLYRVFGEIEPLYLKFNTWSLQPCKEGAECCSLSKLISVRVAALDVCIAVPSRPFSITSSTWKEAPKVEDLCRRLLS